MHKSFEARLVLTLSKDLTNHSVADIEKTLTERRCFRAGRRGHA